jgi:membrane protein DedA with SNARE-associated domain
MPDIINAIARYGYESLFVALLLEALGLPIPGALALLAAGAASASGALDPLKALGVAAAAMLLGDCLLFTLGRYSGWYLLGFLCGLSLNPETCILRSARWFYERGRATLLFAKFIPGVNTMAPPLAGSMNMKASQFLRLDVAGALTYILVYGAMGYLFHGLVQLIAGEVQTLSQLVGWLVLAGFIAFLAQRVWLFLRHRASPLIRRVSVHDVAGRLEAVNARTIVIADVRSHGYYDPDEQRVRGSIRIEPNNLEAAIPTLSRDTPIFLYCT